MRQNLRLRQEAIEWRDVDGEIVVLDLRTSLYLAVNETGARLWHTIASGATPASLIAVLVGEYGLDEFRARADVEAFLDDLRKQDLLEERSA